MVGANILRMIGPERIPAEVRKSVVTIHTIDTTRVKSGLVTNVFVNGHQLPVSKMPVLSNRDISFCEPFEYREGEYGLRFRLTAKGTMQWQQTCSGYRGMRGVMALGGQFKCFILFSHDYRGPSYKIAAKLSKKEAEEISRDIIRNYEVIKENS